MEDKVGFFVIVVFCFFLLLETGSCFPSPDWPGTHFLPAQAGTQASATMLSRGSWIDGSLDVSLSPGKKLRGICISDFFSPP